MRAKPGDGKDGKPMEDQHRDHMDPSVFVLLLLYALKGAEMHLLPCSFRAMEHSLGFSPSTLAMLALCQGLSCALAGPLWGSLVDSGASKKLLLKVGVTAWGSSTFLAALLSDFYFMAAVRVIIGSSLAMLLPVVNSMVADITSSSNLGQVFGKLDCASSVGSIVTVMLTVSISEKSIGGILGWRVAQGAIGAVSLLAVPLVEMFVSSGSETWRPERFGLVSELVKLKDFCKIGTYRVLIFQGMFGTMSGAALSFFTMYLQYLGINNYLCGAIQALGWFGAAFGSMLGGYLGDLAHSKSANYGRTCVALTSVGLGVPFLYVTLKVIPMDASYCLAMAAVLFLSNLCTTWEVPGCITPMLIDVVPRHQLSSAFALELALVFASGTTVGPLLAGYMTEKVFGYQSSRSGIANMSPELRERNAAALGNGIFYSCLFPVLISLLFFCLLFKTYPEDRDAREKEEMAGDESDDAAETARLIPAKEV
mmetsp:Transcript_87507/g.155212  ORF Transcript_87507/g.155212 Transcript_87507/m.155212 type:complete len:481 (-) Transcript_87507:33-1475(-)|eukprot:CAMPEP_0197638300 /NCGR_PEP_ID=MMETSP1338-20131121/13271_1 /TAXON_ID=43686 ORGANISM="Pelagodinium beii, Strain RCC1491" /NCGR_SAMPLE_ID=MMETSP1338 /ASSEMBLY_ACC=CAM_ASM_000754 /LENGTH=480 /DNA_ID=CAMNT_0043210853 /DNA_START=68 /DNA_END=1510 /DNA_ORIENTATION=-